MYVCMIVGSVCVWWAGWLNWPHLAQVEAGTTCSVCHLLQ